MFKHSISECKIKPIIIYIFLITFETEIGKADERQNEVTIVKEIKPTVRLLKHNLLYCYYIHTIHVPYFLADYPRVIF